MVFSSILFLCIFLPLTVLLYYILPHRLRNSALLVASLIFYAWGEPKYILIMLFSTVFDYTNGILLEKFYKKEKVRRLIMTISVVVNIGILVFFKYTDFAIENIDRITGADISLLRLALPIGISFYTFQTLSYTIDVYRRKVTVQHNIIDFGMYICLFPQLIAGPIVRYCDIEKQIKGRQEKAAMVWRGIMRFSIGLAKKVLLANSIGALWEEVRSGADTAPALTLWLGAVAFAFQIYFDFSGYSDMAIGLGEIFGFRFPENFRHPYCADSITDFWRRWHITLGTWFREYVYIPLGGNRLGTGRQVINIFVVWFLTGLWHGAEWNFIIWGLYWFVILTAEKLFLGKLLKKLPAALRHFYALLMILVGWVIFACDDIGLLGTYFAGMSGANGGADSMSIFYILNYGILLAVMVIGSTRLPLTVMKKLNSRLNSKPALQFCVQLTGIAVLLGLSMIFIIGDSYNPFLYFRF